MNVLTISASDYTVGGAARIAVDIHQHAVIHNPRSKMYSGKKYGDDPTVIEIRRPLYTKVLSFALANDIDFFQTDYLLNSPEFLAADIVHCHNLNGWYFNLGTMVRMSRVKPVIWTLHDMWALTPHCGHTSSTKIRNGLLRCSDQTLYPTTMWNNDYYLSWRKRRLYAQGKFHVVVPCLWLKGWVEKTCLASKSLHVIPNGVDTETFKVQDKSALRKRLGLDSKRRIVMFLGSSAVNNVYKGFSDFSWLAQNWRDDEVQFVAVGAENDGNDGRVRLIRAKKNKAEVSGYVASADVLVLPSRHEVFPLVVLEALASGVPVVAYDVGGVREAIDGLPACRIASPQDKTSLMKKLKESLEELVPNQLEIGAKLRSVALKKYSTSIMIKSYFDLYHRILST